LNLTCVQKIASGAWPKILAGAKADNEPAGVR
jgi:hypothetical protein